MNNNDFSYYNNLRPEMATFIQGAPHSILEIGCGAGRFRDNFKDEIEYWGIEPCTSAATLASASLTHVLNGTYDEVASKIPDHHFDLIVCNDVIEHMPDPKRFLQDIRKKLVKDGAMIVSVPNVRNAVTLFELLIKGDFQYVDAGVLDYTHLHLFTMKSFTRMAEESGWHVELCRPLPSQPFKPIKNIVLNCIKPFIPEIRSTQIAFRLRK